MRIRSFFTKITHWEHWPTFMFYFPLTPFFLYSGIKGKHPLCFLTTNPAIKHSGDGTESKFETINLIPKNLKPIGVLISTKENLKDALLKIKQAGIEFPLIAKPDIGFRGFLVKKIDSKTALKTYLEKYPINIIIQEFVDLPNECGIFYHRIPDEDKGKITSITLKKFLTVTGNGSSSLSDLILADERAYLYYDLLQNIHKEKMLSIPVKGEKIRLTVIGNHSKGTQFINGNHLITKDLELMFDNLTKQINHWYYGRLDIKYDTFEKLIQGKDFKIIEMNGIISEPTHIYDPNNISYFGALKSIKEHWKIIFRISKKNHDLFNIPYPKLKPYLKNVLWLRRHSKELNRLNKLS
ncbi:MAG: hypothetical protein WBM92_13765 [Aureibaculum sp.]